MVAHGNTLNEEIKARVEHDAQCIRIVQYESGTTAGKVRD